MKSRKFQHDKSKHISIQYATRVGNHCHRKLRPKPLLKQSVQVYKYQEYDDSFSEEDINPLLSGHKTPEWYLVRFPHYSCCVFLILPYAVWSLKNLKSHVVRCDRKPVFCNKCIFFFYWFIVHVNASCSCWHAVRPTVFHSGADSPAFYWKSVLLLFNLHATKMKLFCNGWLSWSKLRSADCFEAICLRLYTVVNLGFFLNVQKSLLYLIFFSLVPSCIYTFARRW